MEGFDKHVDLKLVGRALKEALACGGTVKNGIIELQGDHQKKVKAALVKIGFAGDTISD